MARCELCGVPCADEKEINYCSKRCLMWDMFGVPVLKERELVKERVQNLRTPAVEEHDPGEPYTMGTPWKHAEDELTQIIYNIKLREKRLGN